MILDLSYREFQKEYFGEKVSRHSASMVNKELVDNLSYTYNGLIWIKNDIFIFPYCPDRSSCWGWDCKY